MAKVFARRSIVFTPDALDALAHTLVDTKLPSKPDMSQLYTDAYLSK